MEGKGNKHRKKEKGMREESYNSCPVSCRIVNTQSALLSLVISLLRLILCLPGWRDIKWRGRFMRREPPLSVSLHRLLFSPSSDLWLPLPMDVGIGSLSSPPHLQRASYVRVAL